MRILITAALPYANGPLHIGHLVEYVQADIYSRFLKLQGNDVLYICASDSHGTPIEVNAKKQGVTPLQLARKYTKEHQQDFKAFAIGFDNYYTTHSPENKELVELFFTTLTKKGLIYKKLITVIYCPHCQRYLPDRYVRGTCPHCSTMDQYGDICENCGVVLKGIDLLNPKCTLCGKSPVTKESESYFFKLSAFSSALRQWLNGSWVQPEIRNNVRTWIDNGLEDWCISRDGPYFGFKIPGESDKYFYVWMDAPIGYISSTKNLLDKTGRRWQNYWKKGNVHHFIGKDIIYFHFLFWPALLLAMDLPLPQLTVHGFLTVNGKKMSKSRGTFFTVKDFLNLYEAEHLRFYYALHLSRKLADVDLDLNDFQATINNKLLANLGNFCYRTLSFIDKNYGGVIGEPEHHRKLISDVQQLIKKVERHYQELNVKEAVATILKTSDLGNAYFQNSEPWADKEGKKGAVFLCATIVRNLAILIKPVLPVFAARLEKQLGCQDLQWKDISFTMKGKMGRPEVLVQKIERIQQPQVFPLDLRVGEIEQVDDHPNADRLYVLGVNFGGEKRQIVAGLKAHFDKAYLKGKRCVFLFNIKPAMLRGIESNGMILVASDGRNISLLETEQSNSGEPVMLEGYTRNTEPITFYDFEKVNLRVANGHVEYEGVVLHTEKEHVVVKNVKDGALVS
jgi:methionyl-tRNA synthetase